MAKEAGVMEAAKQASSFESTLREAARQSFRDGEITRWELARINLALKFNQGVVNEVKDCIISEASNSDKMFSADEMNDGAFDWTKVFEFIMKFIQQIISIIKGV